MTIEFQIRGMKEDGGLRRQVQADLESLNRVMALTSVHVALECQQEVTPAYQAVVILVVSGPDIHAAARDHTWTATWQKVVARLREQMEQRRSLQTATQKGRAKETVASAKGNNNLGLGPRKAKIQ